MGTGKKISKDLVDLRSVTSQQVKQNHLIYAVILEMVLNTPSHHHLVSILVLFGYFIHVGTLLIIIL